MRKFFFSALFCLLLLPLASAETLKMKSGKIIVGDIVEKTGEYIKVQANDQLWKIPLKELDQETKNLVASLSVVASKNDTLTKTVVKAEDGKNLSWDTDADELANKAAQLFMDEQFAQLETMAENLRQNKIRRLSGDWMLEKFYLNVLNNVKTFEVTLEKLDKWRQVYPDSITQRIALAVAYNTFGWNTRGTDVASNVKEEAWKKMQEQLQKAHAILVETEKGVKDPFFYTLLVKVSVGLSVPKEQIQQILQKGISLEPEFFPLYEDRAFYLQPKWGGEPGELERFAEASAQSLKNLSGYSVYALIAKNLFNADRNDYSDTGLAWEKTKQGFFDLQKYFPYSLDNIHTFARLACFSKDQSTAHDLFDKLGEGWDVQMENFWGSQENFSKWKKWASSQIPYPGVEEIVSAIYDKDLERVKKLLDEGRDINAQGDDGLTPLMIAIKNSKSEIAKYLIEKGADITIKSYGWNSTAFGSAVGSNNEEMVRILLEHGALINEKDVEGRTLLYYAVKNGHASMVKLLLSQEGIEIDAADKDGWTPLLLSVHYKNSEILQTLVEHGADVNVGVSGWPALIKAAKNDDLTTVEALLKAKNVQVNIRNSGDWTPLHYAALNGNEKMVLMLLEHGADADARTAENYSPLGQAKYANHPSIQKIIIEHGGK